MKKKLLGVALCMLLLVGVLAMSASAAGVINHVALTAVAELKPDVKMDFVDVAVEANAPYEWFLGGQVDYWYDETTGTDYKTPGYFTDGHVYIRNIYIEPESGYTFSAVATASVNGHSAKLKYDAVNDMYFVQARFDACGSVENIDINCVAPVIGQKPGFNKINNYRYESSDSVSPYSNGISWYDETAKQHLYNGTNQKFESHHVYTVTFKLVSKQYSVQEQGGNVDKYYEFINSSATVNGEAVDYKNISLVTGDRAWKYATVKYTFAELGCAPELVEGELPSCNGTGHVGYYACSCGKWYWDKDATDPIENKEDVVIPPTGAHTNKNVTTKATLSKNGKVETKCSVCGTVSKTTTVYYPKTIKLEYTSVIYNGKTKTPSVTVKDSKGNKLKKDTDYTVKYASGRKSTGKYSVTITFKGKYSGTKKLYFNILPGKTSKITPTCSTTEIKASWKKVTGASGYKVELLNSKGKVVKKVTTTKTSYTFKKLSKVTTYKIRVTAYKTIDKKAAYSTVSTTITTSTAPAKVTLSKITAGSKSATPAWKTVSGASGYEVQYSTSSKFKSAKTATVKKGSSKKTTIKKLTKGKKYYFKVRAYKTVGSVKVYGSWSAVKSVKVK